MLKSLLKYELKASGRILIPLYIAVLAMGLISAFSFKINSVFNWNNSFISLVSVLLTIMLFVLIVATVGLSFVISIYRYKKNLLGNEGYLMNTLPVSASENIMAKLISAMIYQFVGAFVSIISGFIFISLIASNNIDWSQFYNEFARMTLLAKSEGINIYVIICETVVLMIFAMASENLMIYAAMSIGHSSTSHKVVNSVFAYIIFYFLAQFINFVLIIVFAETIGKININTLYSGLSVIILSEAAYAIIYFMISNYFLKKKLNLQ